MLLQWIRQFFATFGRKSDAPLPPLWTDVPPPRYEEDERERLRLQRELTVYAANILHSREVPNDDS